MRLGWWVLTFAARVSASSGMPRVLFYAIIVSNIDSRIASNIYCPINYVNILSEAQVQKEGAMGLG